MKYNKLIQNFNATYILRALIEDGITGNSCLELMVLEKYTNISYTHREQTDRHYKSVYA